MKIHYLFAVALVAFASAFSVQAGQAIDISPKILKFIQDVVLDDMLNAVQGFDSQTDKNKALKNLNITASVDAKTLAEEYAANEVAADQKYKVRKSYILVSGVVESINKDFKGDPYVSLRGNVQFQDVQARFSDSDVSSLAALKKGQKVMFVCEVSGRVVAQVMLRNCTPPEAHAFNRGIRAPIDQYVADIFSGKRKPTSKESAEMLSTAWFLGQRLPADSTCFSSVSAKKCTKETEAVFKAITKDDKSTLASMVKMISPE